MSMKYSQCKRLNLKSSRKQVDKFLSTYGVMYIIVHQIIFPSIPYNAWFGEEVFLSNKQIFTNFKSPFSGNKS